MSKPAKIWFCVLFFGVCGVFLLAFPFLGASAPPSPITENGVNPAFFEEFDAWFGEALPFRSQLITGADFVKSRVLASPAANVVTGRDGWVFYEDTVPDYIGQDPMTAEEVQAAAVTLSLLQEHIEAAGGRFLFAPVPNKNSVYGDYMPARYRKAAESDLSRLLTAAEAQGVRCADLLPVLANTALTTYHKRDTHWNNLGALLGCNAMMDALGKAHDPHDGTAYTAEYSWQGDLDKLLYPAAAVYDKQYVLDVVHAPFRFTYPAGVTDTAAQLAVFMSDREENDHRIKTAKLTPTDGSSLYMVRDSFGRALLPFLIDAYDTATFVRTTRPEMAAVGAGSDMIYEIAERNLRDLIVTAPYMMAPRREEIVPARTAACEATVYMRDEGYAVRLYGTADESFTGADGRLFVQLAGDGGNAVFEAFPIRERELLGDEPGAGFSLWLNSADLPAGEYTVYLISGDAVSGDIGTIYFGGNEK